MTGEIDYESVITVPENGIAGNTHQIRADARIRTVLIPEECLRARIRARI